MVTVTAETYLADLVLLADQADPAAVVDTAMVTLLPGETHTFRVSGPSGRPERLTASALLRAIHTGNELFHVAH
jgi:beta-mannosidase